MSYIEKLDRLPIVILNELNLCLDEDIFGLKRSINPSNKNEYKSKRKQHRDFVMYLVSVATHPIGLRASVKPYNCNQEEMLLYLMDMFSLTEAKLRTIIVGKTKSGQQQTNLSPLKRHSWRPELRIRLHPPTFFYKEGLYLDNLYVRVYLFEEKLKKSSETIDDVSNTNEAKNRGMLNKIFKNLDSTSSTRIRSLSELRQLVRFESGANQVTASSQMKAAKSSYKMTQILGNETKLQDDIHLDIRRFYCEPQSAYILRFEFWLNNDVLKQGCVKRYQRCLRELLSGKFSGCSQDKKQSIYQTDNQDFYGFVNVKLSNLPSYATKQTFPILSLKEKRVNNCEISLELRNRRILEELEVDQQSDLKIAYSIPKRSNESFLINHMRLYCNCILYQCLSLSLDSFHKLAKGGRFRNVTLDHLMYLPGYTLINQHRLQSNLSVFDDQCLRRVSILLLLIKLETKSIDDIEERIDYVKTLLISLVYNEYIGAHRLIDDKTLQEVDPFFSSSNIDFTRMVVLEIEFTTLRNYLNMFLKPKLDRWLLKSSENSLTAMNSRIMTLYGLKLFKTALVQLKRRNRACREVAKYQVDVATMRSSIERHLCRIIINHLKLRVEEIVESERYTSSSIKTVKRNKPLSSEIEDDNLWLQLLHSLRYIQHDLTLYWSRKGLNSLVKNEETFVKKLGMFKKLEEKSLSRIVEAKLESYLK